MVRLTLAFYDAATFLKDRVEQDGWHWTANYLREHVRAATGLKFSNSVSPTVLRLLCEHFPEFRPYITLKPTKVKPT